MASRARSFCLSMTTAERRALSPVFVALPWATEQLVQSPKSVSDFLESMPQHKHFLNALHAYETRLLAFRGGNSGAELLQLLGMDVEYAQSQGSESNVVAVRASSTSASTVFDYLKISSHICAFRLFEVLGLQSGVLTRSEMSTTFPALCLPKPAGEGNTLYGLDKLDDWPKVLFEFRRLVLNAASKDHSIEFVQQGSGLFSLLCMRRQVGQQRGYYNIADNFLSAALHAHLMRMIHAQDGALPDYPTDLESRKYNIFADEISDSDYVSDLRESSHYVEEHNVAGTNVSRSAASLRAALHLALLISPFFLLFAFNIGTKSFSRRLALEIFSKYARSKSPLVVKIESYILDALTRLSKGDVHPHVVFMDLIDALPWDAIEAASNTDQRRMFPVMPCTSAEAPVSNDGLHTVIPVESPSTATPAEAASIGGACDSVVSPEISISPPASSTFLPSTTVDLADVNFEFGSLPPVNVQPSDPTSGSCIGADDLSSDLLPCASVSDTTSSFSLNLCNADPSLHSGRDLSLATGESTPDAEDTSSSDSEQDINMADSLASCINSAYDASATPVVSSVPSQLTVGQDVSSLQLTETNVRPNSPAHDVHSVSSMSECFASDSDSDVPLSTIKKQLNPLSSAGSTTNRGGDGASGSKPKASSLERLKDKPAGSKPNLRKRRKSFTSRSLVDSSSDTTPEPKKSGPAARKRPKLSSTSKPDVSVDHHLIVGNSLDNPINVDDLPSMFEPSVAHDYIKKEDISLGTEAPPPKIKGNVSYTVWDGDNSSHTFTPEFHYPVYVDRFDQFMNKTLQGYIDGKPPFLSEPKASLFDVIKYNEFTALSASELQERMMKKHLVVTGMPHEDVQFDETAMRTLIGSLTSQVSINDFSVKPADGDCMPSVVSGYASDILLNARPDGKILNGLDFPMGDADRRPNRHAVDLDAWNVTRGQHRVPLNSAYPTEHMRWGSGGTQNTITLLHLDCDGLNTNDGPLCGLKLWGVAEPISSEVPRSSIYYFLHEGFSIDEVNEAAHYKFEAIVLRPGDVLYMKANTAHFVYGITPAICHGGHYYLTLLMQETLQGVIHAFVLNKYLTNTQHWPTRQIFRRILFFYHLATVEGCIPSRDRSYVHVPDVNTFDGLLNLLSLCIIVVLGNVLDFRTYKAPNLHDDDEATSDQVSLLEDYDINDIPYNERIASCYARGVALYVMQWIRSCTVIKGPDGEVVPDLPSFFLVQILNSLVAYKLAASRRKRTGAPHCTYLLLKSQALNVLDCSDPAVKAAWDLRSSMPSDSLELADKDKYSLEWKHGWEPIWRAPSRDFLVSGLTPFDNKYFKAIRHRSSTGKTGVLATEEQR